VPEEKDPIGGRRHPRVKKNWFAWLSSVVFSLALAVFAAQIVRMWTLIHFGDPHREPLENRFRPTGITLQARAIASQARSFKIAMRATHMSQADGRLRQLKDKVDERRRKRLGGFLVLVVVGGSLGHTAMAIQKLASDEFPEGSYLERKKFRIDQVGELKAEDGTHLAFRSYKSADGTLVTVIHTEFKSPVAAQEFFERQIVKAARVHAKGVKTNRQGAVVGKRAEMELDSGRPNVPFHAILWTNGTDFFRVQSMSAKDTAEFEKSMS